MKRIKIITLSISILSIGLIACSFSEKPGGVEKSQNTTSNVLEAEQKINMFVTHGHCSTPFTGNVEKLNLDFGQKRTDGGNPIENLTLSFEINPNSFIVCKGDELTNRVKTPGLFLGEEGRNMTFKSTNIYTMGIDWYQVNGELTIKGMSKEVKFFMTGIRDPKESMAKMLVLEGQLNLMDWGIDYDLIVSGKSDAHPTKWMHLNMIIQPS